MKEGVEDGGHGVERERERERVGQNIYESSGDKRDRKINQRKSGEKVVR